MELLIIVSIGIFTLIFMVLGVIWRNSSFWVIGCAMMFGQGVYQLIVEVSGRSSSVSMVMLFFFLIATIVMAVSQLREIRKNKAS